MEALVINLDGQSYTKLRESIEKHESRVYLTRLRATTPETLDEDLKEFPWFKWTWPLHGQMEGIDLKTGVYKFVYQAQNQQKKVACSVSHMRAWNRVIEYGRPMYIFESDAVLVRSMQPHHMHRQDGSPHAEILGLNDPRGATRRSQNFHQALCEDATSSTVAKPIPTVNYHGEHPYPQGLAGNSAYYITPKGAKALLEKAKDIGMWPNDAFMCKEVFPWLRTAYPYFTKVSGEKSTTVT